MDKIKEEILKTKAGIRIQLHEAEKDGWHRGLDRRVGVSTLQKRRKIAEREIDDLVDKIIKEKDKQPNEELKKVLESLKDERSLEDKSNGRYNREIELRKAIETQLNKLKD